MAIQIPTPNIIADNDRDRLLQIQSYLYKMAQQLQWAFNTIETGGVASSGALVQSTRASSKKTDSNTNFAAIKDLIIKSADIVEAYYEQISERLEGKYVAISDFGTYKEKTALELQKTNTSINQLYTNIREISETLDGMYDSIVSANAYIKSGLLYEDENGVPVYGLEIGQTNTIDGVKVFDKFARFSSDRLSFYDRNDVEVAYISDYKLYITNAEITGTLWLSGKFKIFYNGGLAFQWMGGNS